MANDVEISGRVLTDSEAVLVRKVVTADKKELSFKNGMNSPPNCMNYLISMGGFEFLEITYVRSGLLWG